MQADGCCCSDVKPNSGCSNFNNCAISSFQVPHFEFGEKNKPDSFFETPPPLILCILLQTKTEQCLLFQEHEGCKVVGSWLEIVCIWTSNI
jgi:hypothetical protein